MFKEISSNYAGRKFLEFLQVKSVKNRCQVSFYVHTASLCRLLHFFFTQIINFIILIKRPREFYDEIS